MRRGGFVVLGLGLVYLAGCKHENPAATVPVVDEYTVPPDDPKYNNPPTADYKKPAPKKEWGAKPGMAGSQFGAGSSFGGQ
jgi:hypothetical protein